MTGTHEAGKGGYGEDGSIRVSPLDTLREGFRVEVVTGGKIKEVFAVRTPGGDYELRARMTSRDGGTITLDDAAARELLGQAHAVLTAPNPH